MNNTFTSQELMQIFGLYPNAKVKSTTSNNTYKQGSLDYTRMLIGCLYNSGDVNYTMLSPLQLQLELIPISEITDEHAIEIAKIVVLPNQSSICLGMEKNMMRVNVDLFV